MTFIRISKDLCPKNVYELSLQIFSSPMLKEQLPLEDLPEKANRTHAQGGHSLFIRAAGKAICLAD